MNMKNTQMQLRIECMVKNGRTYPSNTYFIDTHNYQNKPFIDEENFLSKCLSEEDIKSGGSYEDIKPAIQTRLAHMEYGKDVCEIINKYCKGDSSIVKRTYGRAKIIRIELRNNRLMNTAVKKAVKRNGGLVRVLGKALFSQEAILTYVLSRGKSDLCHGDERI